MTGPLDAFLARCRRQPDRFAAIHPNDAWRVGGVVFAGAGDRFIAVRKAPKDGYEFAGLWALPGGMVRVQDLDLPLSSSAATALSQRFEAETGLVPEALTPVKTLGPVTTAYSVDNERRHTVMMVYTGEVEGMRDPRTKDPSISEAAWLTVMPDLATLAPGNRVILGHLLWQGLSLPQRQDAGPHIAEALIECTAAAAEAGITAPVAPWAPLPVKDAWIQGWPTG